MQINLNFAAASSMPIIMFSPNPTEQSFFKNSDNNSEKTSFFTTTFQEQNSTQNSINPTTTTIMQEPFVLSPIPKKSKTKNPKFKRNRPANLSIPTKISAFNDQPLDSITPPPVITSKSKCSTASQITENLILGSEYDAQDPEIYKKFKITKVLTIMSDNFTLPDSIKSILKPENIKFIKLNDTTCSDISTYFREAIEFMETEGDICLVHCRAGISRSSTLIMAYLMEKNSWSLNEAFTFTKSKRSCVAPNFGFLGQLQKFEDEINKASSSICA